MIPLTAADYKSTADKNAPARQCERMVGGWCDLVAAAAKKRLLQEVAKLEVMGVVHVMRLHGPCQFGEASAQPVLPLQPVLQG